MKKIRSIIRFLGKLFQFAWRMLWRLLWTAAFSFLILIAVIYFMTDGMSQGAAGVTNAVDTAVYQLTRLTHAPDFGMGTGELAELAADNHTDHYHGVRWNQTSATVYIDPAADEVFQSAYEEAIANWNQTGAFTFQIVDSQEAADIFATEMNDGSVSAVGEAESQTNLLTNRFVSVTVRLNAHYLLNSRYQYSQRRIVNTAEHELGHAIGLDHNNEEESVMQSAGSFYSIQESDIQAVNALYQS